MGKHRELLDKILLGGSDASIDFKDLCGLLIQLGFAERIRGSHHVFRRAGIEDHVNLQSAGRHAKVYQVRQVRGVILRYRLGGEL